MPLMATTLVPYRHCHYTSLRIDNGLREGDVRHGQQWLAAASAILVSSLVMAKVRAEICVFQFHDAVFGLTDADRNCQQNRLCNNSNVWTPAYDSRIEWTILFCNVGSSRSTLNVNFSLRSITQYRCIIRALYHIIVVQYDLDYPLVILSPWFRKLWGFAQ